MNLKQLYEQDFYAWTEQMSQALQNKQYNSIDWEHLIEEIDDMGKRERRALESRIVTLIMHLLKWQVQDNARSNSWLATIKTQRLQIKKLLKEMPSLKQKLPEIISDSDTYREAVLKAQTETGLSEKQFPVSCPYTIEQLLDDEFFPEDN